MNRDQASRSALLALARTRRMQRALAHAYLHRGESMPTLRTSLGYMTSTAGSTIASTTHHVRHRMRVLGVSKAEAIAYVVEELGDDPALAPIVYRLWLRGPREGHLVPIHAWYEQTEDADEIRARIASLEPTLEPVMQTASEAWMLSTRVVQRRALRVGTCNDLPIRKFALQLLVEPVSGHGPSGRTTVTAFLRPQAQLVDVWALSSGEALARVSYAGVPASFGLAKDTVVLLT